jgi:hypothetical protein
LDGGPITAFFVAVIHTVAVSVGIHTFWVPDAVEERGTIPRHPALFALIGEFAMRMFVGMILGALMLTAGVYVYDSMSTSTVANGQVAQERRTIVNWDVAATDWQALKTRTQQDWIKLSQK